MARTAAAREQGALTGSWHPFQTFIAPSGAEGHTEGVAQGTGTTLSGVTFGIEAGPGLYDTLADLTGRVVGVALAGPAWGSAPYV